MQVIRVRNVNEALYEGTKLLLEKGETVPSRVGDTLEVPEPVATVYEFPWERVLFNPVRDANPFFHLMESMWILAGRRDVKFLTEFNKRMADYSDDGNTFNAAYGYRIGGQLKTVIEQLRMSPNSRRAVVQIWDSEDLYRVTKDMACNLSIVFKVRNQVLDMTVYNRSNDMLWGAYGANAVQFSMIHEYVAGHLGITIGTYTQVSNSFHVYLDGPGGELWDKIKVLREGEWEDKYVPELFSMPMGEHPTQMKAVDIDIYRMFNVYDNHGLRDIILIDFESEYFEQVIKPVLATYIAYKDKDFANVYLNLGRIESEDWQVACREWIDRRTKVSK